MNAWIFILMFCVLPTACYAVLWGNRRRWVRLAIRRRVARNVDEATDQLIDKVLTQARNSRLISAKDEAALRKEYGVEAWYGA